MSHRGHASTQELLDEDGTDARVVGEGDVRDLRRAWINEKVAPLILPYKEELVERIASRISSQEDFIRNMASERREELSNTLYQMELDRVKYLLRSYLRDRLKKIQAYCLHILDRRNLHLYTRLSSKEQEFVKGFVDAMGGLFYENVLGHFPHAYQHMLIQYQDDEDGETSQRSGEFDMIPEPNSKSHVFVMAKESVGDFQVEGSYINIHTNDLFVTRYNYIETLLKEDSVQLV